MRKKLDQLRQRHEEKNHQHDLIFVMWEVTKGVDNNAFAIGV